MALEDSARADSVSSNLSWLTEAILESPHDSACSQVIATYIRRWLSMYSSAPERLMMTPKPGTSQEERAAERKKRKDKLDAERAAFSAPEAELLKSLVLEERGDYSRLNKMAFRFLAGTHLSPFAESLRNWCFAASFNGGFTNSHEEFDDLVQFNLLDWADARTAILKATESNGQVGRPWKFREWLLASKIPIALVLAGTGARDQSITCTSDAMRKLERRLFEESGSLSSAHLDCQILGKIVAHWNSKGGRIPQPRLSYLFSLPINPFGDGVIVPLQLVRKWLELEDLWITECAGSNSLELVVFSAVLHGGLFHTSNIVSFVRALFAPDKALGYIAKRVYVDLTLPWRGMPDMERRDWQPDDQTASMIRPTKEFVALEQLFGPRWNGGDLDLLSDSQVVGRLFTKIKERMRHSRVEEGLRPMSFNHLLKSVAICAQMEVPAVLVEYASRGLISHSLKPHVLRRIYNQPEDSRHQEENSDSSINFEEKEIPDLSDDQDDIEPNGFKDLRKALRTEKPAIARARLESLLANESKGAKGDLPDDGTTHEPPPPNRSVWFLITDFALYMLTRRRVLRFGAYHRKLLQLSSVQKYALIVGRRLGRQLGDENLLTFTALNIETAYTKVLERVLEQSTSSPRMLQTVANALREFQNYLELEFEVQQIDREVLGVEGGLLPVDSNIVTLEEYQKALQLIRKLGDERIFGAAEAMLILGFCCGTRRMEAHGMKVEDLIDRGPAWLILRPSEERRLKTPGATRQLPLQALIPNKELQVLLKRKRRREKEGASNSSNMFCEVDENGHEDVIHIDRLMPIIHGALRDATTDISMHYHHLRHSCATWMFLRLMLSDLPRIPDLFPHLESTTAWLKKSRSFRIMLYGRGSPTRQHGLAVASLLGHSGHRVTMENYVHCLDWLLPVFLEQNELLRVTSTAKLVTASSFDESTIYLWEQRRRENAPFNGAPNVMRRNPATQ
jgi:integrase